MDKTEYIKVIRCCDCVFLNLNFTTGDLSCGNLKGMIKPTFCGGCSYGIKKEGTKNE